MVFLLHLLFTSYVFTFTYGEMKNYLKVERAKNNLTQEELAARIGVSRQTINAVEKGKFIPSTLLALKLAREFKVPVDEVFKLEEEDG